VVEAFYTGSIVGASKPVLYTYFFTQGEELEKIQNLLALKILKFKKMRKNVSFPISSPPLLQIIVISV
jgi:hypothetical protein